MVAKSAGQLGNIRVIVARCNGHREYADNSGAIRKYQDTCAGMGLFLENEIREPNTIRNCRCRRHLLVENWHKGCFLVSADNARNRLHIEIKRNMVNMQLKLVNKIILAYTYFNSCQNNLVADAQDNDRD